MKVYGIWNKNLKHWDKHFQFYTKAAARIFIDHNYPNTTHNYEIVPWPTDDDEKPDAGTPIPNEILWHISKGRTINILDLCTWPEPEEMIRIIAWGLAGELRFGAQPPVPYTVAQHSVAVCDLMKRELLAGTADKKKIALLHDAHEALGLRDLASPVKEHLPGYKALADAVQAEIWEHFGITRHSVWQFQDELKACDEKACAEEQEIIWDARNISKAWQRADAFHMFMKAWEDCR